jgi:hypothetical protein
MENVREREKRLHKNKKVISVHAGSQECLSAHSEFLYTASTMTVVTERFV